MLPVLSGAQHVPVKGCQPLRESHRWAHFAWLGSCCRLGAALPTRPSPQAPADPPLAPERAPYSPRGSPGLTGSLSLRTASLPSIHCPFHPSRCWQHHFSNSKSEAPAPCRAATGSHRTGCHLQHLGAAFPPLLPAPLLRPAPAPSPARDPPRLQRQLW